MRVHTLTSPLLVFISKGGAFMKKLTNLINEACLTILIIFSMTWGFSTPVFGQDHISNNEILSDLDIQCNEYSSNEFHCEIQDNGEILSELNFALDSKAQNEGFTVDEEYTHLSSLLNSYDYNSVEVKNPRLDNAPMYLAGGLIGSIVGLSAAFATIANSPPYTPKKIKTLYGSLAVALGGLTVAAWGAIHTFNSTKITG